MVVILLSLMITIFPFSLLFYLSSPLSLFYHSPSLSPDSPTLPVSLWLAASSDGDADRHGTGTRAMSPALPVPVPALCSLMPCWAGGRHGAEQRRRGGHTPTRAAWWQPANTCMPSRRHVGGAWRTWQVPSCLWLFAVSGITCCPALSLSLRF